MLYLFECVQIAVQVVQQVFCALAVRDAGAIVVVMSGTIHLPPLTFFRGSDAYSCLPFPAGVFTAQLPPKQFPPAQPKANTPIEAK